MLKRFFDFAVAFVLLVLVSPVLIGVALVVWSSLGHPVLFRQQRPGLHGKPFVLYKFRSMTDLRDSDGNLLPDEIRLTEFGKVLRRFSLDELPQMFNIIRGDMSLVGPRPLLMEYMALYSSEQMRRHDVRPGITGLAQVKGRNTLTWEERFAWDVWYVDHHSLWLDMKIIWQTLLKVICSEGIDQPGGVTMPKFTGSGGNAGK